MSNRIDETAALNDPTRAVAKGDLTGGETAEEARVLTVNKRIRKKINHEATVLADHLEGASKGEKRKVAEAYLNNFPSEERKLLLQILVEEKKARKSAKGNPDEELSADWREGGYPY